MSNDCLFEFLQSLFDIQYSSFPIPGHKFVHLFVVILLFSIPLTKYIVERFICACSPEFYPICLHVQLLFAHHRPGIDEVGVGNRFGSRERQYLLPGRPFAGGSGFDYRPAGNWQEKKL